MLYHSVVWLFRLFAKHALSFTVTGAENIPARGGFILAANHTSYLDPLLLGAAVRRELYYMGREELFKRGALSAWVMRRLHTFPVKRHGGDLAALRTSLGILKQGGALGIFPEGTRVKHTNLKRGKPGIGFIVAKAGVPVIPAYIEGAFEALPHGRKTFKRHPVAVRIGEPIIFDAHAIDGRGKEVYQEVSDRIMARIAELKGAGAVG